MIRYKTLIFTLLGAVLSTGLLQCGNIERPLDSDARNLVDSLSVVGISKVRQEIDSQFKAARPVVLPHLVDSIRKVREREIEQQLKTIPK